MDWKKFSALLIISVFISSCALGGGGESSLTEFTDCEYCPEMVNIPTGSYVKGDSTGEGRDNERPTIPTSITRPFAISKFPITIKKFQAFVNATDYKTKAEQHSDEGCWGVRKNLTIGWLPNQNWRNNTLEQEENHPVVCVTWNDASSYAQWLSAITGFNYRLPSEAEWEYAARAGEKGKYYFGDDSSDICDHINHADYQMVKAWDADTGVSKCDDGFLTTSPVGHFPPNKFGLYDFYGNVWEWVGGCYLWNQIDSEQQTIEGAPCAEYALRGASWASRPEGVTTSYRISSEADTRTVDYGFRLVREWK